MVKTNSRTDSRFQPDTGNAQRWLRHPSSVTIVQTRDVEGSLTSVFRIIRAPGRPIKYSTTRQSAGAARETTSSNQCMLPTCYVAEIRRSNKQGKIGPRLTRASSIPFNCDPRGMRNSLSLIKASLNSSIEGTFCASA